MSKVEKKEQDKKTEVSELDTSKTSSNQKDDDRIVEKNMKVPPLGALLDKRTEEIRNVIFSEMAQNGIPASLMDYMLSSILAEVRDLKAKEYSNCIISKEE